MTCVVTCNESVINARRAAAAARDFMVLRPPNMTTKNSFIDRIKCTCSFGDFFLFFIFMEIFHSIIAISANLN